ncbi:S8 family peptidase [Domibacillus epiphyticus]|uniref:Peptidase S8/S53 domain-containing protein n=1 Tax=Domibacillus epiphyticus TaxID=1714355 RepID=A0A1V2ABP5_9BACI|nr:S8 family peptidase [Domibacillus epiphyticus]OMP68416.1 hypothetical protein BTO28_02005 [Domibacillus epiphyticus]
MGRVWIAGLISLSLLIYAAPSAKAVEEHQTGEKEVVIVYKNSQGKKAVLQNNSEVAYQFKTVPAVAVTATKKDLHRLENNPHIESIEENITFSADGSKPDAAYRAASFQTEYEQWNVQAVNASQAWTDGFTGAGVKIAVVDTGIASHADLSIAGGMSTVDYTSSWTDDNGHGTHVAGIIGARKNGIGTVGVAPEAQLFAVKALGSDGEGKLIDILEAVDWAIANKMDIINLSLGTDGDSQLLNEMLDNAYEQGILIVGSAGNNGTEDGAGETTTYPAKYDSVIAVSAVNVYKQRAAFSSTGKEVEFTAPGEAVISTYVNEQYASINGTSQAAPHVSGLFALLKQKYPSKTNVELRHEMKRYAEDLGAVDRDPWFGYGLTSYMQTHPADNRSNINEETFNHIEQAVESIALADKTRKLWDYDTARNVIGKLPDGTDKETLQQDLITLQKNLELVEFTSLIDVQPNKTMRIAFNTPIEPQSVNDQSVFVRNDGTAVNDVELSLSEESKVILVKPPADGYVSRKTYFLYVDRTITSVKGKPIKFPVIVMFTVK